MNGLQGNHSHSAVSFQRSKFLILVVLSAYTLFAFVMSAYSANLLPSASAASIARASTTSTAVGYPVKVYFSRVPDSLNNPKAVFPVNRRILAEINATLKQFANIKNVVVLNQAGHCFPALGPDLCLK